MPRQGLNRNAVIEAAIQLANKEGFSSLSLGELARQLDIRPPSLYKHIQSLEDLQDEIGIRGINALIHELNQVDNQGNPQNTIYEICIIYRNFALKNKALYESIQPAMTRRSPKFQESAKELLETILSFVTRLKINKKDYIHAVRSLRSLMHGFIELERQGGFGMKEDLDKSFQYLVKIFTEGVMKV